MPEEKQERLAEISRRVRTYKRAKDEGCFFSWMDVTDDVAFLWDLLVEHEIIQRDHGSIHSSVFRGRIQNVCKASNQHR